MNRIIAVLLGAALFVAGVGGCNDKGGKAQAASSGKLRVVCTVGMIGDAAREIAGDRAGVEVLIGAGVDPHLYKPTRTDIGRLMEADVVFYNGLLLEGKMTDSLIRAAGAGKRVYVVAESLDEAALIMPEEMEGHHDPHVWMDPARWMGAVEAVRDGLIEADPGGESVYYANAAEYLNRLRALDMYAATVLASVPTEQRVLVTAHDAFNYFGDRFGYEVVGIQGISTESEAGVRDIERLVELLVQRNVGAVFVESTVSERNINALVEGAEARGHRVVIGGELFSDAMGDEGTYEGTYIGMIDHNATTIARALGGVAPEGGLDGKLGR